MTRPDWYWPAVSAWLCLVGAVITIHTVRKHRNRRGTQ